MCEEGEDKGANKKKGVLREIDWLQGWEQEEERLERKGRQSTTREYLRAFRG